MPRPLVAKNDPVLHTISSDVEMPFTQEEMGPFLKDMWDTMYAAKGIGLAAVQIGFPVRIAVLDVKGLKYVLINPIVVSHSDTYTKLPEGCLSLPGKVVQRIPRYERVEIQSFNEFGHSYGLVATGLLARCIQHELDHMNGVLISERARKGIMGHDFTEAGQKETKILKPQGEWVEIDKW